MPNTEIRLINYTDRSIKITSTGASLDSDFQLTGNTFSDMLLLSGLEEQTFYKYIRDLRKMLGVRASNAPKAKFI